MKNYTAKNLNELLENVASEKGVKVEDLIYTITEEKKGILGIGASVSANVYCMNDVKEFIFEYLEKFFTEINLEIEAEIEMEDNFFKVYLNAENNAVLIGKNGQTLQALNNVVKAAINAEFKRRFNILIDINNYKQDRYAKLISMAKRIAKTVKRTKVTASLDPMPNDERKAIHQALSDMENIATISEGEGSARHLTIVYKEN